MLCEVILRTNPIPPVSVLLRSDDVDPFVVPDTVLRPTMVLWDGTTTWVELAGHGDEVAREQARLSAVGGFVETTEPPDLPRYRWSLDPATLRDLGSSDGRRGAEEPNGEGFVDCIGVGVVLRETPQPGRSLAPALQAINDRMKAEFDPAGRLNPGRNPARR